MVAVHLVRDHERHMRCSIINIVGVIIIHGSDYYSLGRGADERKQAGGG